MISDDASRALILASGLVNCRDLSTEAWQAVIARIVLDLDEAGNSAGLQKVICILTEAWDDGTPQLTPQQEYEAACKRYNKAVQQWPHAQVKARKALEAVETEYEEAKKNLARFEVSPGIVKPEYAGEGDVTTPEGVAAVTNRIRGIS